MRARLVSSKQKFAKIDFDLIKRTALTNALPLCRRYFAGFVRGDEFHAKNPHRADRRAGSLKINLKSGVWCDFATGERGGDLISLVAWRFKISQSGAAQRLAEMLLLETTGAFQ